MLGEETQSSTPTYRHPLVSPPSPLIPLPLSLARINPSVSSTQPPSIPTWSHQPGTFAQPPPPKTFDHGVVLKIILISIIVILLLICLFFIRGALSSLLSLMFNVILVFYCYI
jgi:hypothetical protein